MTNIPRYIEDLYQKYDIHRGQSVALALSGGVDSAVALVILQELGLQVNCYYMTCWNDADGCSADLDYHAACTVATYRNAPIHKLDYIDTYKRSVFDQMTYLLELGLTPNPDIFCNSSIKFGRYYKDMIAAQNYDYIATGHYATIKLLDDINIVEGKNKVIGIPLDTTKDQSYYLSRIDSFVDVNKIIFPLQGLTKIQVREIAKYYNLPNYSRPDSQGICFVGDVDYKEFISKYVKKPEGKVVDIQGKVIGKHKGLHLYTIGQRHGFELSSYTPNPLYVVRKDFIKNHLVVGSKQDCLTNFVSGVDLITVLKHESALISLVKEGLKIRIRSLGELIDIESLKVYDKNIKISTKQPIFATAPGQIIAIYYKDVVIASAVIS